MAISIETGEHGTGGLDPYVVLYGTARITEGGAAELLDELAKVYLGPEASMGPPNPPPGFITHIAVDRVTGIGPWA